MENLAELARQLAPYMAQELMKIPTIWGEPTNRVIIGQNVSQVNALFNTSSGNITLEDFVFFGHNVCVLTGVHEYTKKGLERRPYPKSGRDILIKKHAWIGSNATILGPCVIGENAVVAAGAVVTSDIPDNCVYGGVPAKFIKKIGD